jgi:cell division protein FtsB
LTTTFAYHAIHGRHGLLARNRLHERLSLVEFEMQSLEAVRAGLRRDVALLSPELPNEDVVEEIAREMLGFVRPDDHIIVTRP